MSHPTAETSAQRLRLTILIIFLIALVMGSFWVLRLVHQSDVTDGGVRIKGKPDYYIEQFKYVKLGINGQPRYDISGQRMVHFPEDDSYEVTLPVFTNLDTNKAPMNMRADRGLITDSQTKIHLYDNVTATRAAFKKMQQARLTSAYLLVIPDDNIMRTDKPVEVTMGNSVMTSTGMIANNELQELRLLKNVRGIYRQDMRQR